MIPDTIGRYEVQGLLGEGAFGQVFAAHDPVLGRAVAIKVLRTVYSSDASFMERFGAEAASLAALTHPNITAIYDLLQDGDQHGMIMELVRGHTLEHVLAKKRRLEPRQALAIVAQTAAGLGYVHRRGVVHRDIKPANIMLTAEGVLKIMDFGIARIQGAKRLTRDGSVVGTLAYAAPEQIKTGAGEPQSDQYSLACMLYEMLCGDPPFDASSEYELMQAQIAQPPMPASTRAAGLPAELDQALLRALAKNPADRFDSVEAFGRALGCDDVQLQATAIVSEIVSSAGPLAAPAKHATPQRSSAPKPAQAAAAPLVPAQQGGSRSLAPMLVMGGAAAVALAVGGYILFDSRAPAPAAREPVVAEKPAGRSDEPSPATSNPPKPSAIDIASAKEPEPVKPAELRPETRPAEPQAGAPASPEPRIAETRPAEPRLAPPEAAPRADRLPAPSADVPPARRFDDSDAPARPRIAMQPDGDKAEAMPPKPAPPKAEEQLAARPAPKPSETAPPMPSGPPNYRGRVLSWPSGGTIRVRAATGTGWEFFRLWGVRDLSSTKKQSDVDAVADKLEQFFAANGREATCFKRHSNEAKGDTTRYLCFVGNKDVGLWAIENGLAEATGDAPAHYRQAAQR